MLVLSHDARIIIVRSSCGIFRARKKKKNRKEKMMENKFFSTENWRKFTGFPSNVQEPYFHPFFYLPERIIYFFPLSVFWIFFSSPPP